MVCLFSHYYTKNFIPNYVLYYLEQLSKHVDKIILLTNNREINNKDILEQLNIDINLYENSGYDFGMYYKFLTNNKIYSDKLLLVNDSMILFNNLDKIFQSINDEDYDLLSITDSTEVKYHLQSYFWIMNEKVQEEFISYLNLYGIIEDFNNVIHTYEIGFSQYLLDKKYKIKSLYSSVNYSNNLLKNSVIHFINELTKNGLPMIKKKVFLNSFNEQEKHFLHSVKFNFNKDYNKLIEDHKDPTLNLSFLFENLI